MELLVLGSSSAGNCYILKGESESLIIECGMHFNEVKKALNYEIGSISGAIVTHLHGDHSRHMKTFLNHGVNVFAGQETSDCWGLTNHHRLFRMEAGTQYVIGGFKVKPFSVNHDVSTFGFLIRHEECGLVLFLTDTHYTEYLFPGLNNMIVECNHSAEYIKDIPDYRKQRLIRSHMNLDTCKKMLLATDLSKVNNLVLIHLSEHNADPTLFRKEIINVTGKNVTVAVPGLRIPFNKTRI